MTEIRINDDKNNTSISPTNMEQNLSNAPLGKEKKLRDLIHRLVSIFIPYGKDSLTQTELAQKQLLTASFMPGYYWMIRPSKSNKLPTARKSAKKVKRKKRR